MKFFFFLVHCWGKQKVVNWSRPFTFFLSSSVLLLGKEMNFIYFVLIRFQVFWLHSCSPMCFKETSSNRANVNNQTSSNRAMTFLLTFRPFLSFLPHRYKCSFVLIEIMLFHASTKFLNRMCNIFWASEAFCKWQRDILFWMGTTLNEYLHCIDTWRVPILTLCYLKN